MRRLWLTLALLAVVSGCATAPQQPVPLSSTALAGRIGITSTRVQELTMSYPGADCLLCLAAAATANSALSKHVKSLPLDELVQAREEVAAALRAKGATVEILAEPLDLKSVPANRTKGPNVSAKDFRELGRKLGFDRLLVIEVQAVGMQRSYTAYFPTSDPRAVVMGAGYMVNVTNNALEWYAPINVAKAAEGAWDEPPAFPGLTNAYFQAVAQGKQSLIEAINR